MTFGIAYFNTGLVGTKFRPHERRFRALGTIVPKENLGTCRLAIKLDETKQLLLFF